jgi:hypothetical protein
MSRLCRSCTGWLHHVHQYHSILHDNPDCDSVLGNEVASEQGIAATASSG